MSDSYKCYGCTKKTLKVGEPEIMAGWGKFQGRFGFGREALSLTVVHCPTHADGFVGAIWSAIRKLLGGTG